MIRSRYAAATAFVVALALVPTVIHSYLGVTVDDGVSGALDSRNSGRQHVAAD